jgi:hypothetical protein
MFAVTSCQKQPQTLTNKSVEADAEVNTIAAELQKSETHTKELLDIFTDNSKIAIPHKNKVELSLIENEKNYIVELKFYSLAKNNEWNLNQTVQLENYASFPLDAELKDFNNDGFKDLTYISGIAARGANEIRNLLIYDKTKNELVYIKNSGDYPNLLYNKELDCIDAQRFYGGNSTDFVKIEGDMLKDFARVETFGTERTVYLIDKNGNEKLLRKDKVSEDSLFERYKTFNPPQPYTSRELEQ